MDTIVGLIDALAWPVAAVCIANLFKAEFRFLLMRITSLKYKDAEAKFEQGVEELAKERPAEAATLIERGNAVGGVGKRQGELLRISEVSPRAAIMEAWIDVEHALAQAAMQQGFGDRGRALLPSAARQVLEKNELTRGLTNWYEHLRRLRNEAAHAEAFNPSPDSVQQYLEYAQQLVLAIGLSNLDAT
jgi:hypothetical protein